MLNPSSLFILPVAAISHVILVLILVLVPTNHLCKISRCRLQTTNRTWYICWDAASISYVSNNYSWGVVFTEICIFHCLSTALYLQSFCTRIRCKHTYIVRVSFSHVKIWGVVIASWSYDILFWNVSKCLDVMSWWFVWIHSDEKYIPHKVE